MLNLNIIKMKDEKLDHCRYFGEFELIKKRIHFKEYAMTVTHPIRAKNYTDMDEMISDYNKLVKMGKKVQLINVQYSETSISKGVE